MHIVALEYTPGKCRVEWAKMPIDTLKGYSENIQITQKGREGRTQIKTEGLIGNEK